LLKLITVRHDAVCKKSAKKYELQSLASQRVLHAEPLTRVPRVLSQANASR